MRRHPDKPGYLTVPTHAAGKYFKRQHGGVYRTPCMECPELTTNNACKFRACTADTADQSLVWVTEATGVAIKLEDDS